jgi:succinoglycan biosynthesis transport protein ExoP
LREEEARLSQTLGDRHPEMVRVRTQIRSAEQKLREEARAAATAAETDYRTALARESRLQANLEAAKREAQAVNRKGIQLGALRREVESNRQIYEELLTRTQQTGLETKLNTTNIRVIEEAEPPGGPVSPNKMRNYQVALLLGLMLGVGLALLFENFDNTFKTPEDVKNHLGVPFLGMVPDVTVGPDGSQSSTAASLLGKKPNAAVADAYRVLRTNLLFTSAETTGRAFVMTSAGPAEGKTTTLANLGAALAHNGSKVLAIDADLRRPKLHQHFRVSKTPGLTDMIIGNAAASKAIRSTRIDGLMVLPCGYQPPNPAELLGSAMMKQIMEAVRSHYDWVLVDTPPMLAMADAAVVCPTVEGVVLVVAGETSSKPQVLRAVEQIQNVGSKVLGVVLNKVNLHRNAYYYSQNYGEYYRTYYIEGRPSDRAERDGGRRPPGRAGRPARRA